MWRFFARRMIVLSVGITLFGCNAPLPSATPTALAPADATFATAVPIGEMNTKLKLRLATEFDNKPRIDSDIPLVLDNVSQDTIGFVGAYGLKLFMLSEQKQWVEIDDRFPPYVKNAPALEPKGSDLSETDVDVWPALVNEGEPVTVRVLVVGAVYQDSVPTTEKVAAYTDVVLSP